MQRAIEEMSVLPVQPPVRRGRRAGAWFYADEALARRREADYLTRMKTSTAKYRIGDVVRHRIFPFRGVVFDIDPEFDNTEEWYQAIPAEVRPRKDQPFYHLFAENAETEYIAYVSEQNLLPDTTGEPVRHPQVKDAFEFDGKGYRPRADQMN
jgi:heat shock protein HspQ